MTNPNISPELLDLDLSSIDTSFTVVTGGLYDLLVKESDIVRNNADNGDLWVVKLATTREAKDIKGAVVKEGQVLFHRMSITPTDNYAPDAVAKNVARFTQACKPLVTGIKAADLFNGEIKTKCKAFVGRTLQAKVEALPEGLDKKSGRNLPPRNEISQLVKAS